MSAGFTPGPWELSGNDANITRDIVASDGSVVCSVWNVRHYMLKDTKPDTFLIVAAPELYEALERINDTGDVALDIDWIRRISRAALAKANGEQVHSGPLPKEVGR